jgi:hypothetical protein
MLFVTVAVSALVIIVPLTFGAVRTLEADREAGTISTV